MSVWEKWGQGTGSLRFPGACARLAAVLVAFGLLVAPFNFHRVGWPGVLGLVIAMAACWIGGSLALAVTAWSSGPHRALWAMFGGVFRMFLPLGIGFVLDRQVPALAGTGVFGLMVVFYLLTLVVETWLSLGIIRSADREARVS